MPKDVCHIDPFSYPRIPSGRTCCRIEVNGPMQYRASTPALTLDEYGFIGHDSGVSQVIHICICLLFGSCVNGLII